MLVLADKIPVYPNTWIIVIIVLGLACLLLIGLSYFMEWLNIQLTGQSLDEMVNDDKALNIRPPKGYEHDIQAETSDIIRYGKHYAANKKRHGAYFYREDMDVYTARKLQRNKWEHKKYD